MDYVGEEQESLTPFEQKLVSEIVQVPGNDYDAISSDQPKHTS